MWFDRGVEQTTSYTDPWNPQPAPVDGLAGATVMQWPVIAAVWLLAAWAPYGMPGWRARFALDDDADFDFADAAEVDDVAALLRDAVPVTDERGERLRDYLAEKLTGQYTELRRVPGDDLTLVFRDQAEGALRLTIATAGAVEPPPAIGADGPDGGLRTRLACVMTLLSDMLWVDDSNPVTFAASIRSNTDERKPDPELQWRPISEQEAWEALENTARASLDELADAYDASPDEDTWPPLPAGHIAAHLCRDLLGTLVEQVRVTRVVTAGYWPDVWADDDEETICSIVFEGYHLTAVLDIDFSRSEE
ncbi:hypothetical protein [Dactylosporangium sp. CA-139066]|uniref:hypothetical protein n=1 Tax=Dactylosporangium sp. CA-139066 TaxID=3239930 RepID=UPI003D924068